jgi:hypothetical protein
MRRTSRSRFVAPSFSKSTTVIHRRDPYSGGNSIRVVGRSNLRSTRLCNQQDKQPGEVLGWASTEGHAIYRVRRGTSFRFYIRPVGPLNRCGQEGN